MANEITISRRSELLAQARTNLAKINDAPMTSEAQATKAVRVLVDSYPQATASCPDVYMRQLRGLLTGVPLEVTMALVDPARGILSQCTFLPTIAEVYKWLTDFQEPQLSRVEGLRAEIKTLENDFPMEELTPEERERRIKATDAIKEVAKRWGPGPAEETALERRMNERFAKTQRHVPELAMAALRNLEAQRGGG